MKLYDFGILALIGLMTLAFGAGYFGSKVYEDNKVKVDKTATIQVIQEDLSVE